MATAFNTTTELLKVVSFVQGADNSPDSLSPGSMKASQLQLVLQQARDEIARKTRNKENAAFDVDRAAELKEAEIQLAASRLYAMFAERQSRYQVNPNPANAGEMSIGTDSPTHLEKANHWVALSANARQRGLELLNSRSNVFSASVSRLKHHDCYQPQIGWSQQELYGYPYQSGCVGGY